MPYKDPEVRKAYNKQYKRDNHGRVAAHERNINSARYHRLREVEARLRKHVLDSMFGGSIEGVSIVSLGELDNPGFIVVSPNGRLKRERLRGLNENS